MGALNGQIIAAGGDNVAHAIVAETNSRRGRRLPRPGPLLDAATVALRV